MTKHTIKVHLTTFTNHKTMCHTTVYNTMTKNTIKVHLTTSTNHKTMCHTPVYNTMTKHTIKVHLTTFTNHKTMCHTPVYNTMTKHTIKVHLTTSTNHKTMLQLLKCAMKSLKLTLICRPMVSMIIKYFLIAEMANNNDLKSYCLPCLHNDMLMYTHTHTVSRFLLEGQ